MKGAMRLGALLLSLALCAAAAGCGARPSGSDGGSGVLRVQIESSVQTLDPQRASDGVSFEVIANLTDGLTQPDEDGRPVPAIAEDWEVSDDQLTWTFRLREDALWSTTGNPVTARDFVYAWQRAVDPETGSASAYLLSDVGCIENAAEIIAGRLDKSALGVEAPDERTLVVHLSAPVAYFPALMYLPVFYPVEEAFLVQCGADYALSPETLQSNGAFCMASYSPSATEFTLVKNERYWDADRVQLQELRYQRVQESQQALLSYRSNTLDLITLSGEQAAQVRDDPAFNTCYTGYLWYLALNTADVPALGSRALRLALANAIDRETLVASVLQDGSRAAYFYVPDELAYGPDGQDFRAGAGTYGGVLGYDVQRAQGYLEQAKAELGMDSFTLDLIVDDEAEPQRVAKYLQKQIETALPDVTVNVIAMPKEQRTARCRSGDFEIALTRWGADYADPMAYLSLWRTGNVNNYGRWSSPVYDGLLDEAAAGAAAGDPQARWAALQAAEAAAIEEMPAVPLYEKSSAMLCRSTVTGVAFHPVALNRVYKDAVVA